jgi:hypothetical protein
LPPEIHRIPSFTIRTMSGRSRSVHFPDDEAFEAQEAAEMQQQEEDEQPRLPASQQILYRALMTANAIAEYGGTYVNDYTAAAAR